MHPVPEGMSEDDANAWRSRLADVWRFDKTNGGDGFSSRRR